MKKFIAAAVIAAMLASLSACGQTEEPENAEYIYGKIDSVSGNDIVLLLADYNEESDSEKADGGEETDEKSSENAEESSGSKKKSRSFSKPENGEMPEGFDPSKFGGERPERSDKSSDGESTESTDSSGSKKKSRSFPKPENGEMPEGFDPSKFGGEKPERSDNSGSGTKPRSSGKQNSRYTLTGEQEELRIPVGVTVITSLGVKTDFDALSAGDMIKCSIEKNSDGSDVVTEVWILEN